MPKIIKVLLLTLLACAVVLGGIVGWIAWAGRAQGEPQAKEFSSAEISAQLSGATVLGLGEATHGNSELQRLRLQLVGKLPNFRAVVIEEDYGSVVRANRYINGAAGTAEEAARSFGFVLNHTREMAELLRGLRELNADRPAGQRVRLVGMDVQRVDANKDIALHALRKIDPASAAELDKQWAGWNDDTDTADVRSIRPAVERLRKRLTAADDVPRDARNAAATLQQNLDLGAASNYAATRAEIMAANLRRTVEEEAERGNDHTLLFAHAGHLDKTSAAFPHADLGQLAARHWGDRYRVIGTEVHHSRLRTGAREDRWQVTLTRRTPLRGMFAPTKIGYLEFAAAGPVNRKLLDRSVRMTSAGESFHQWQAWVPWLNSVSMTPSSSYDALIMVDRATPVAPLP